MPWVNHPRLIDAKSKYDDGETPSRYSVRIARHNCGKIAGVPMSTLVIPTTDGATALNTMQYAAVDEKTVTGSHNGKALLRTSITIKAMIAISMFAFEISIGKLRVLIA